MPWVPSLHTHTHVYPDVWNTFFFYQRINELLWWILTYWGKGIASYMKQLKGKKQNKTLLPSGFLPSASHCWTWAWACSADFPDSLQKRICAFVLHFLMSHQCSPGGGSDPPLLGFSCPHRSCNARSTVDPQPLPPWNDDSVNRAGRSSVWNGGQKKWILSAFVFVWERGKGITKTWTTPAENADSWLCTRVKQ